MGHVQKRVGPDGKPRWKARWIAPDGTEDSKTFTRKVDATQYLSVVEASVIRDEYIDPHDRTTVAEYAYRWAAARPHRPTSAKRVESLIRCHIAGVPLGRRRLRSVLPSDVQAWATDRAQVLSPSTLRNLVSLLGGVYGGAVADRLVTRTPVVNVKLPSTTRERVVPLVVDQVRALAAAMPERNRAMVPTQAGLGLRIGELLALQVEHIDFLRRTVRIECQIAPGERTRSEPKTPTSRRTLPLPQVVAEALAEHIRAFPPTDDGTVFYTRAGMPYRHDYYGTRVFQVAAGRAGLPAGTTPHDLRHHFASVLLAAGESVVAVAERLGHENASMVLKVYGHLLPGRDERTRKAIDDAWSSSGDGLQTAQGGG